MGRYWWLVQFYAYDFGYVISRNPGANVYRSSFWQDAGRKDNPLAKFAAQLNRSNPVSPWLKKRELRSWWKDRINLAIHTLLTFLELAFFDYDLPSTNGSKF